MDKPPIPAPVQAYAPELGRLIGLLVQMLKQVIARRFLREPRLIPLILPLCRRLDRVANRMRRLMALIAAGRLPRVRKPRPARAHPATPVPRPALPRGRWWLIGLAGYQAAGCRSQLEALLASPEAAALLAAVPAAARLLGPLIRILAIGATPRTLRTPPVVRQQYCALPPALDPQWGRPPECETWHRWSISPIKPSWP